MFEDFDTLIPEDLAIKKPKKELLDIINNKEFDDKILYSVESDFHNISVVENEIGRFLHYDNTYQAGWIKTDFYKGNLPYINYFLIPYLMNPEIKNILLIGLGSGKLVKDYEFLFENLKSIDVVDIEENSPAIAKKFFGFEKSEIFNFELQDGITYLRNTKQKYELIVTDIANNNGIDTRFLNQEYFGLIKKTLKKEGIFVSNLCASPQFDHCDNKIFKSILNMYKNNFKITDIYKGDYSDKVYYKCFFDLDERVIDITNVIFICSDKFSIKNVKNKLNAKNMQKIGKLDIDINDYLNDLYVEP